MRAHKRTVAYYTAAVLNARRQRLLFINHALISPILTHPELDNFSYLVLLAYTAITGFAIMRSIRLLSTLTFIGHLFYSDSMFTQTADVYRLVSPVSAANTAEPIVGQFGLAHTLYT